jgi:hypothetical protein
MPKQLPIPHPHPHGRPRNHNFRTCDQCQRFVRIGGPAAQRATKRINRELVRLCTCGSGYDPRCPTCGDR